MTFGISPTHGPHQVAQKSINTTFPRYCASDSGCPTGLWP